MMQPTLEIRLKMVQGALVRAIRTAERRSREIVDIEVRHAEGTAELRVAVEERIPAESLAEHLRKQYDVESVRVLRPVRAVDGSGPGRPLRSAAP